MKNCVHKKLLLTVMIQKKRAKIINKINFQMKKINYIE